MGKEQKLKLLVTGGLGFIGSHTVVELMALGYEVVILDSGMNSSLEVLKNIETIAGQTFRFYKGDLLDVALLDQIFQNENLDGVIHFAALKSVPESLSNPLRYYKNNVGGTVGLLEVMERHKVKKLVFSSTAAVYGPFDEMPLTENSVLAPTTPYGYSKLVIEHMLSDLYQSDSNWQITLLRYFNPVGAHPSGLIGEAPKGLAGNVMPCILEVATGKREYLEIYGDDYQTSDGTGVRDFLHIVDLAKGHVAALQHLDGLQIYNLGTGTGYSVLDLVQTFERVNGIKIPIRFVARRQGDVGVCYADPSRALEKIGWKTELDLDAMCRDAWHFSKIDR